MALSESAIRSHTADCHDTVLSFWCAVCVPLVTMKLVVAFILRSLKSACMVMVCALAPIIVYKCRSLKIMESLRVEKLEFRIGIRGSKMEV